jgi:hypothetical protein
MFFSARSMAKACSPRCAQAIVEAQNAKKLARAAREDRKRTRAQLLDLKPLSYWRNRAQTAFNAWVRARDAGLPCVSCGRHHEGQYHAGHYLSRGARPELAFEPLNVHKQCRPCNEMLAGNIALYRAELIRRIGLDKVEWLEGPHPPRHYSADDYRAIEAEYKAKVREIEYRAEYTPPNIHAPVYHEPC